MNLLALVFTAMATLPGDSVLDVRTQIVGGSEADFNEFPEVSVQIYDQYFCGGTIVNPSIVLTAAHCVNGMNQSQVSVRVRSADQATGESVKVSKVIQHSDYNPVTRDNDVAILRLNRPFNITDSVRTIALQPQGVEVPAGTTAWVSGWGVTSDGSAPALLSAVEVAVITNTDCAYKYEPFQISSHMMCAQTLDPNDCQGDSGGPLIADGKLIGVVSWGYGCASPQYPGVYAKVSDMHDWIVANS